jgi:hypothetical protein
VADVAVTAAPCAAVDPSVVFRRRRDRHRSLIAAEVEVAAEIRGDVEVVADLLSGLVAPLIARLIDGTGAAAG